MAGRPVGPQVKRYGSPEARAKLALARTLLGRMKAYLAGKSGSKLWPQPDGSVIRTQSGPMGDIMTITAGVKEASIGAILLFGWRDDITTTYLYWSQNGRTWHEVPFPDAYVENPPYLIEIPAFSEPLGRTVSLHGGWHVSASEPLGGAVYSSSKLNPAPLADTFIDTDFQAQAVVWVPKLRKFRTYGLLSGTGTVRSYESADGVTWSSFVSTLAGADPMEFEEIAAKPLSNLLVGVGDFDDTGFPLTTGVRSLDGGTTWDNAGLPDNPFGPLGPVPISNVRWMPKFAGAGRFVGVSVSHSTSLPFPDDRYINTVFTVGASGWEHNYFGCNDRFFNPPAVLNEAGLPMQHYDTRPAWSPRHKRLVIGGTHITGQAVGVELPSSWGLTSFTAYSDDLGETWTFVDGLPPQYWGHAIWSDEIGVFVVFGEMADPDAYYGGLYTGPPIVEHCLVSSNGLTWDAVEIPDYMDQSGLTHPRRSLTTRYTFPIG